MGRILVNPINDTGHIVVVIIPIIKYLPIVFSSHN